MSPYNEVEPFEGCQTIDDEYFDFSRQLFSNESGCVNLTLKKWAYRNSSFPLESARRCHIFKRGLAPDIYKRSREVLAEQGMPERFGAYHVRRCDRMRTNAACTDTTVVASVINNITEVKDWMLFYYAEEGYIEKLKEALRCPSCNRTIVFEDGMRLNPLEDGDNYYTFLVAEDILRNRATVSVESQYCDQGIGSIKRQAAAASLYRTEEEGASGDALLGLCWGRTSETSAVNALH